MTNLAGRFSMRAKIIANNAVLMALLVVACAFAINGMNTIGKELATIAEEDIPLANNLSRVTTLQLEQPSISSAPYAWASSRDTTPAAP